VKGYDFISVPQIAALHHEAMKACAVPSRIRDVALLKTAVAAAQSVYTENRGDLCDAAAAYAYYIIETQPFAGGNKCTALLTALTLLKINGRVWQLDEAALSDAINAIAEKRMDIAALAVILRTAVGPEPEPHYPERREFRRRHRR